MVYIIQMQESKLQHGLSTEARLLLLLRYSGGRTLNQLADELGLSRMGVYKRLVVLEKKGLVTRKIHKTKLGRPAFLFMPTEEGRNSFGNENVLLGRLVEYLDRTSHGGLVSCFLKDRYATAHRDYSERLKGLSGNELVLALAEIRSEEGYMAESRLLTRDLAEMVEYACPIFEIAKRHAEACIMVQKLFSELFGGEVESTHRQVDGRDICRFVFHTRAKRASKREAAKVSQYSEGIGAGPYAVPSV